jgi:UTP-glucose-1-phosphate uridylyltransferase
MTGPTLLIMAAGMGSRYGGLKQIDPVGPNGECIIDYSLHDAIAAGFKRVVFVVRRSFEQAFHEKMARRLEGLIDVAFACQELDTGVPVDRIPAGRQKPWGTGHAVLAARGSVDSPFAVINADDYYGRDAYRMTREQLDRMAHTDGREQVMVGYLLRNTLSEHGGVSRGVCQCNPQGYLDSVTEQHGIQRQGSDAATVDPAGVARPLSGDQIVSMNFWGFHPRIFEDLQRLFEEFLRTEADASREFYLPTAVNRLITSGQIAVKALLTRDRWFGVTYKPDRDLVAARIRELIQQGVYPQRLWEDR